MERGFMRNKAGMIIVFGLICSLVYSNAFAWGHDGRYYWRGGRWYRPSWCGLGVAVSALTVGAIVATLPYGHRTMVVAGVPYYYYDGYYYRQCPSGYVVVPEPVAVAPVMPVEQPKVVAGEITTINIPNANGSYTPVTLVKRGHGYVGPQGEYYEGHPSVEQLKALYGK